MKPIRGVIHTLVVVAAACLVACGGGGGDPSPTPDPSPNPAPNPPPPDPPPVPQLTLTTLTTSIAVAASAPSPAPTRTVSLTLLNNSGPANVVVSGSYTVNGIASSTLGVAGSNIVVLITFRAPATLAPGTYTDTIIVRACLESPCVNHIAGSPKSIPVSYTVGPPDIAMTLERSSVSIEGFVLDPGVPEYEVINATYSNLALTGATLHLSATSTSNAVSSVSHINQSTDAGARSRLTISLKAPATLGPGVHTDVVTARACLDAACATEVQGSPAIINVTYTVSSSTTGPNGFTARTVAAVANDMVWDGTRGLFYVSMAQTDPANPNTIGVLDPAAGQFSMFAPVGLDPGRLALSANGQYLYVALRSSGSIQRLQLPSLALDLTIPLGTRSPDSAPLYAGEMHVSPEAPQTIAVVRVAGSTYDLAIFDDAVKRPLALGGDGSAHRASTFQWDTGARIFAVDSISTNGTVYRLDVNADGLTIGAHQQSVTSFDNAAHLVNGRMYMQRGRVFNPLTFEQIGFFPLGTAAGTVVLEPDLSTGKAFFLSTAEIRSYDLQNLTFIGSIWLPRADPGPSTRLLRWGPDGLVVFNHLTLAPGILLINGPFVQP